MPPTAINTSDLENYKMGDWIWGSFKHYCPVSLIETGNLIPGKEENACSYKGYLYNFTSDEDISHFTARPEYYINKLKTISIPKPKFVFMGPTGSRRVNISIELFC